MRTSFIPIEFVLTVFFLGSPMTSLSPLSVLSQSEQSRVSRRFELHSLIVCLIISEARSVSPSSTNSPALLIRSDMG